MCVTVYKKCMWHFLGDQCIYMLPSPTCGWIGTRNVAGKDAQCMLVLFPLLMSQVVLELFLTYTQYSIQSYFLFLWVSDVFYTRTPHTLYTQCKRVSCPYVWVWLPWNSAWDVLSTLCLLNFSPLMWVMLKQNSPRHILETRCMHISFQLYETKFVLQIYQALKKIICPSLMYV